MGATLSDVPALYDLVIQVNGGGATTGFVFDDAVESSLPFRTHKATYSHTPTFIDRSNVSGDYGDNQQAFFMSETQRDWSLGEDQRYFRTADGDSVRRFWQGSAIDIASIPGQVTLRRGVASAAATGIGSMLASSGVNAQVFFFTTTNLKSINASGTISDLGAHGLGRSPDGICGDPDNVFLTAQGVGSVGVRKYNGATFSTFSATGAYQIEYLNNTLYGFRASGVGDLVRWDTAGALTSLFSWKAGDGAAAVAGTEGMLKAYGGKLLILLPWSSSAARPSELWIYDGTGTSKVAEFQPNFLPNQMAISTGTVYVSGLLRENADYRPAIYYYAGGNIGLLWKATSTSTLSTIGYPGIASFGDGLVFNDDTQSKILFYSPSLGGVHPIASWTPGPSGQSLFASSGAEGSFAGINRADSNIQYYPTSTTVSSGTVITSLFDFDSSLTKLFRGVTVEFESATDGNGGSVDVAYRVGDVDGSYTSLATGVTSGTETTLSGVNGRSISFKFTLNKGTSTNGPKLKRYMVRAAPILTRYKTREYILNCTGDPQTEDKLMLRDGKSPHPLSGRKQVDQLILAAESIVSNPGKYLTLNDRFGQFDGVIETLEIYEEHAGGVDSSSTGTFVCKITTRQV